MILRSFEFLEIEEWTEYFMNAFIADMFRVNVSFEFVGWHKDEVIDIEDEIIDGRENGRWPVIDTIDNGLVIVATVSELDVFFYRLSDR